MNFLEENAKKNGVTVTKSGLQYKVLENGNGKTPTKTDKVFVHYEGKLVDGTVFDSSFSRGVPVELPVNRVIEGWSEALRLMKEGDEWELYIPSDLAYGEHGAGDKIGPNETLIFKVKLISIKEYKPIVLSERAIKEVKHVLEEQNLSLEDNVLRVGVSSGGCSGFSYSLNFDKIENVHKTDAEYEFGNLKVVVDNVSQPYLDGVEIGFQDSLQGRGFTFNNPNATGSCGCGSSFSANGGKPTDCGSGCCCC